jgi:succinyl-CoA synthetase alpha subunit
VLIGEIGGSDEQQCAEYIRSMRIAKPIVALVVGEHAPVRRRMGHAGALILDTRADVASKVRALLEAGVIIAPSAHLVGSTVREALARRAA